MLVKGGLDLKKRIDSQGIFKSKNNASVSHSSFMNQKKQGISQDYTAEDTTNAGHHLNNHYMGSSSLKISDRPQIPVNAPEGRMLKMYTLIEESRKKKGGQVAADKLKAMIQELVAENCDLKSSSSTNFSVIKNTAIDNFCSNDS